MPVLTMVAAFTTSHDVSVTTGTTIHRACDYSPVDK